jgi:hypothetical protein
MIGGKHQHAIYQLARPSLGSFFQRCGRFLSQAQQMLVISVKFGYSHAHAFRPLKSQDTYSLQWAARRRVWPGS